MRPPRSTGNPYQPMASPSGMSVWHPVRSSARWPTPMIILFSSVVIGVVVASVMTTDMQPVPGQLNLALWAFTGLSLTFGGAGALFGYQYLLNQVPLWYTPVALGFFAVASLWQYPNVDTLSWMISLLATMNGLMATITPWIARHYFHAGQNANFVVNSETEFFN